jgi:peptidoglycan-N-acetylglucosamine deacetylase
MSSAAASGLGTGAGVSGAGVSGAGVSGAGVSGAGESGQAAAGSAGRQPVRRSVLRGVALAGLVAATVAVTTEQAEARHAGAGHDRDAGAVPPLPDAELGGLSIEWRAATTSRTVALTFDDGPDPRWTPAILDLLAAAGARATFFCCGHAAARHPELVRRAAALGEVGNHSWSHPDLGMVDAARVHAEVGRAHDTLAAILGRAPGLFRPPYGNVRGSVLVAAARHRYRLVLWSQVVQRARATADGDVARVAGALAPGQILLAHDGRGDRGGVVQRLPGLLASLTGAGYAVTTVTDLLAGAPGRVPR